jgi:hypothetical protein
LISAAATFSTHPLAASVPENEPENSPTTISRYARRSAVDLAGGNDAIDDRPSDREAHRARTLVEHEVGRAGRIRIARLSAGPGGQQRRAGLRRPSPRI